MTAEELAQELDNSTIGGGVGNIAAQAAQMLRKQAAEIENLQDQFDKAIEFLAKANNMVRSR
jgi:hypothetical protein